LANGRNIDASLYRVSCEIVAQVVMSEPANLGFHWLPAWHAFRLNKTEYLCVSFNGFGIEQMLAIMEWMEEQR
jgi:hypothetical protein